MARARARDGSPDAENADPAKLIKRLRTSLDTTPDTDPGINFAPGVFDHNNIARLSATYNSSQPFKHALVEKLVQADLLVKVKDECISQLSFSEKETDIYKVNQTGDLASLNYLSPEQIALFPSLLALRDALYSPRFRNFLRAVTGCGPLSGIKQDMSVNSYTKGCHLLNHDDVIGTRRVSYILYMPLPHYHMWQKDWGGALELYPVHRTPAGNLEPDCIPSKSVPPSWNQFIFFEVQPGQSFHSVEEVVVDGDEDGRERLSISGWFHAAQEGEEGYLPEMSTSVYKSSREQLQSTQTVFKHYPSTDEEALVTAMSLSEHHTAFLSEFLNPVYLQPRTMQALASRFAEESSLELHQFLNNALAQSLESRLRELDAKDGLGPNRPTAIPPHTAGITTNPSTTLSPNSNSNNHNSSSSYFSSRASTSGSITSSATSSSSPAPPQPGHKSNWVIRGPPHKWRYCTLSPRPDNQPVEAVTPRAAHFSSDEILRSLQDELFPSDAFRAWLAIVAGLMPLGWLAEARRFRPGLDYTLATSEEGEARLDVVLGLTPEARPISGKRTGEGGEQEEIPRGWQAAEWGGWECYMAPHNEEDDPAVYRSGKSKKSSNALLPPAPALSSSTSSMDVEISPQQRTAPLDEDKDTEMADTRARPTGGGEGNGAKGEEEEEEEEEDSTLLTVQPGYNRLLLVLRDERVMRFVKYISAAAEGSRWDVCGEYEVGMVQEEEGNRSDHDG
ncbi:hypothetical protein P691DRAFT_788192 [Macrolepiota fuliginosa MF-IS2]|uniref:uS12 prolyl 3,4-dihydroxylase n=1 Tax=Macrolepiota fuliginosa MF-IS2 TaxID=1400762 RepID=A0A9P6C787_9AGAR|nr:hypothetical protein P691DRAFT_788192 [Macrolepiota fuliginosa MF-IS2]